MPYKKEKLTQFAEALLTFEELIGVKKSRVIQDATIQRFEYTAELFWKVLKITLFETEGIDSATPKSVIRDAVKSDILTASQGKLALQMINDRNMTSHLYSRVFTDALYKKMPRYAQLLRKIYERLAH